MIDLSVGHHAHVVQQIRRMHGRFVACGIGSSLSGMTAALFTPDVQDGIALIVRFERGWRGWHTAGVRFAPTWVTPQRRIVRLVAPALKAATLPAWELAERRSCSRTVNAVNAARIGVWPFRRARLG